MTLCLKNLFDVSSVQSQKGINAVERCFVEREEDLITIQGLVLFKTLLMLNSVNTLLALSYRYVHKKTYRKGTSIRQAPVFRHLRALPKRPWNFILWMNKLLLHCMLLVSYIQQYFYTSITVLTNQVWKLPIARFKVPNTGAFTVGL